MEEKKFIEIRNSAVKILTEVCHIIECDKHLNFNADSRIKEIEGMNPYSDCKEKIENDYMIILATKNLLDIKVAQLMPKDPTVIQYCGAFDELLNIYKHRKDEVV